MKAASLRISSAKLCSSSLESQNQALFVCFLLLCETEMKDPELEAVWVEGEGSAALSSGWNLQEEIS